MISALLLPGAPDCVDAVHLKRMILKLRWIGREDDADRLLHDLSELSPFEITPIAALDTD